MKNYKCLIANSELITKKWDKEIINHNNSEKWIKFKEIALQNLDTRIIYMGLLDNEIITEATAIISTNDKDIQNKENLIDNKIAYLTGFRTTKEYEGKGYFSKLYKYMENDLKEKGFEIISLGVEPSEVRNMKIYFNWGFDTYIKTAYEEYPDGEKILVNYYSKKIN